jgi:hypothetical protein
MTTTEIHDMLVKRSSRLFKDNQRLKALVKKLLHNNGTLKKALHAWQDSHKGLLEERDKCIDTIKDKNEYIDRLKFALKVYVDKEELESRHCENCEYQNYGYYFIHCRECRDDKKKMLGFVKKE